MPIIKRCPTCGHKLPKRGGGAGANECQHAEVARDRKSGEVIGVYVCGCKCREAFSQEQDAA